MGKVLLTRSKRNIVKAERRMHKIGFKIPLRADMPFDEGKIKWPESMNLVFKDFKIRNEKYEKKPITAFEQEFLKYILLRPSKKEQMWVKE